MDKAYIDSFLEGNIYMNPIQYYIDLENESGKQGQGDINEGNICIYKRSFPQAQNQISTLTIRKSYDFLKYPVFCLMYLEPYIESNGQGFFCFKDKNQLNEMLSFSEYCVAIHNIDEFICRFSSACNKKRKSWWHSFVFYNQQDVINSEVYKQIEENNLKSVFVKDRKFALQQEYRFVILEEKTNAFTINIGSIKDIAEKCNTVDFYKTKQSLIQKFSLY